MGLYRAMHAILVDDGPLGHLRFARLPSKQVEEVDVAFVPDPGSGARRAFGSRPVTDGPDGVTNDGGVQWWHSGARILFRGSDRSDPEAVFSLAYEVRDMVAQFAGEQVEHEGEEIHRIEVTGTPYFYRQDINARPLSALRVEIWHRPVRT